MTKPFVKNQNIVGYSGTKILNVTPTSGASQLALAAATEAVTVWCTNADDAWVVIGDNPTAVAAAGSTIALPPAGQPITLLVTGSKIAGITESSATAKIKILEHDSI